MKKLIAFAFILVSCNNNHKEIKKIDEFYDSIKYIDALDSAVMVVDTTTSMIK